MIRERPKSQRNDFLQQKDAQPHLKSDFLMRFMGKQHKLFFFYFSVKKQQSLTWCSLYT